MIEGAYVMIACTAGLGVGLSIAEFICQRGEIKALIAIAIFLLVFLELLQRAAML